MSDRKRGAPETNITDDHCATLEHIVHPLGKLAAFSAFFDGKPVAVLVDVTHQPEGVDVFPLAILLTDAMLPRLTDHDGVSPRTIEEREEAS